MIIKEFGHPDKPTLLIPSGMLVDYRYYRQFFSPLEEDFCILYPVYDGMYPGSGDFTTFGDQADKIESYVKDHHQGHLDHAYGPSQGGLMLVELLSRQRISIDTVFLDGVYVAHQGRLAGWLAAKALIQFKRHQDFPNFLMPLIHFTMDRMGLEWETVRSLLQEKFYWQASEETIHRITRQNYTYVTPESIQNTESFVYLCCGDKEPYAKKSHEELKQYLPIYEENIIPQLGHGEFLLTQTDQLLDLMVRVFEAHRS